MSQSCQPKLVETYLDFGSLERKPSDSSESIVPFLNFKKDAVRSLEAPLAD